MARPKKKPARGGLRPGAGRPPSGEPARSPFMIRLSATERAQVEEAAGVANEKVTTFGRQGLLRDVERILKNRQGDV